MSSNIENDRSDIIQYIHKQDVYYYKQASTKANQFPYLPTPLLLLLCKFLLPSPFTPQQFLKKPFYY